MHIHSVIIHRMKRIFRSVTVLSLILMLGSCQLFRKHPHSPEPVETPVAADIERDRERDIVAGKKALEEIKALLGRADESIRANNIKETREFLAKALALVDRIRKSNDRDSALSKIACRYTEILDFQAADDLLVRISAVTFRVDTLLCKVERKIETGDHDAAFAVLSEVLKLSGKFKNPEDKNRVLSIAANHYGDMEYFSEMFQVIESQPDPVFQAHLLTDILIEKPNYPDDIKNRLFNAARQIVPKLKQPDKLFVCESLETYVRSIDDINLLVEVITELFDPYEQVIKLSYLIIDGSLQDSADIYRILEHLEKISQKIENPAEGAHALYVIGFAIYVYGDEVTARELFEISVYALENESGLDANSKNLFFEDMSRLFAETGLFHDAVQIVNKISDPGFQRKTYLDLLRKVQDSDSIPASQKSELEATILGKLE